MLSNSLNTNTLIEYESYRKRLDYLYYEKKSYGECLRETKDFLHILKKNVDETDYNVWFCYIMLSKIYMQIGEFNKALTNVKKAESYLIYRNTSEKTLNYWILGRYYGTFTNDKKAINIALYYYRICRDYYCEIEDEENLAKTLNNIALLQNDEDLMLDALDLYKQLYNKHKIDISSLDNAYDSLCSIYIRKNNFLKAQALLFKISNISIKNALLNKMFQQSVRVENIN